jgi:hypothetical protein
MQLIVDGFSMVTKKPYQQLQALHCYFPAKQHLYIYRFCATRFTTIFEVFGKGVAENCVLRNDVSAMGFGMLSFRGSLQSPFQGSKCPRA